MIFHWLDDFTWNIFSLFPKKVTCAKSRTIKLTWTVLAFWRNQTCPCSPARSHSSGALHQQSNQVLDHETQTILFQPGSISGINRSLSNTEFNSSSHCQKNKKKTKLKTQTAASIALVERPIWRADSPILCLSTALLSDGKEGHLPPLYHPPGTSQPSSAALHLA